MTRAALMPLPLRAALLAACLTSSVHAADALRPGASPVPPLLAAPAAPSPSAPPAATVQSTPAPGAPVPLSSAASADSGVNPFNGKPLSYEAMVRELELQKVRTALLEENLRATNLNAEIQNVPTRKAAEIAQAHTQIARERAQAATIERDAQAARQAERPAADAAAKGTGKGPTGAPSKKVLKKGSAAAASDGSSESPAFTGGPSTRPTVSMPSMTLPSVELVSVVVTPRQRSVLVDIGGNVVPLSEGETVPQMGQVKIIDADTVLMGNQVLRVKSATLGRLRIPEQSAQPGLAGPGASGYINPALFASTLTQGTSAGAGASTGALPPPVPGATATGRATPAPAMPAYVVPRPGQ